MDSEYPVATIVFLFLAIFTLMFALILYQKLISEATSTSDKAMGGKRIDYAKKQEVANAFKNLVKAYQDCSEESNCMCDIYSLKFPTGYALKTENEGSDVRLSLVDKDEKEILTQKVANINTGLLESKNSKRCSSGTIYIKPDRREWYMQKEDDLTKHYFYSTTNEIYKPNADNACLVTESLSLKDESLEDYFKTMPRCTYKKMKKEELALMALKDFVEEFKACTFAAKDIECLCDFSRITLPKEYSIRIKSTGNGTSFNLVKLKTKYEPEKSLLQLNSDTIAQAEEQSTLSLKSMRNGCMQEAYSATKMFGECGGKNGIDAGEMEAVFFDSGKNGGFLANKGGMIRLDTDEGTKIVNRASLEYCAVQKKKIYNYAWPTDKLNNLYYVNDCFGSGEKGCKQGMEIMSQDGAQVYAAESGLIESINRKENTIAIRHQLGMRTEYKNVKPSSQIIAKMYVTKGQVIGSIQHPPLVFSVTDASIKPETMQEGMACNEGENITSSILVNANGKHYSNPACYFTEGIRNSLVYPASCDAPFKGCGSYGNEGTAQERVRLRILIIPVNWGREISYAMFANDALEKFLRSSPLKECPSRFRKILVDGETDFGMNWSGGSCFVPGRNSCYNEPLGTIKECAEQYKARTGEDYDIVIGIEDSNIAHGPECNYKDRGWTSENFNSVIVEGQYASDISHEIGHQFGLKDQYCDCGATSMGSMCGFKADPNPLRRQLGCDSEECCNDASETNYPYAVGCRWCNGNLDINAEDKDNDNILDSGNPTMMSDYPQATAYSIDEYLYLKTQRRLQCT